MAGGKPTNGDDAGDGLASPAAPALSSDSEDTADKVARLDQHRTHMTCWKSEPNTRKPTRHCSRL